MENQDTDEIIDTETSSKKKDVPNIGTIGSDETSQLIDGCNQANDDEDDDGEISCDEKETIEENGETSDITKANDVEENLNHKANNSDESKLDETIATTAVTSKAIQEDELDFEEDVEDGDASGVAGGDQSKGSIDKDDDDENEDGEVNSDDDLEEGEVKEESEDESLISFMKKLPLPLLTPRQHQQLLLQQTQQRSQAAATKSICKFFHKGQCTWGPSCRFLHHSPAGPKPNPQRKFPFSQPLPVPGPIRPRPPEDFFPPQPHPAPVIHPTTPMPRLLIPHVQPLPQPPLPQPNPPPPASTPSTAASASSSQAESAWERGLRHAKAMIIKATRRKEEEIDFDDKKFNLGVDDEGESRHSHHSLESSPTRGRSPSPYHRERRDEYWSPEYERRRRLAFESAPWNDEPPLPPPPPPRNMNRGRESAEQYRDPWRRSKSPVTRQGGNPRRGGSSTGKHSHSMSSISGSDSASGLSSSSFSGSSFSGSDSPLSDASDYEKSPVSMSRKENQPKPKKVGPTGYGPQKLKQAPNSLKPKVGPKREKTLLSSQQHHQQAPPPSSKSQARMFSREEIVEPKKKIVPSKARRDSWSDSDTGSGSQSESSFYSGSESGSEILSDSEPERKNIKNTKKVPPVVLKQPIAKAGPARIKKSNLNTETIAGPSAKRIKTNQPMVRQLKSDKLAMNKAQRIVSPVCSPTLSPYSHSQSAKSVTSPVSDTPQKVPIKMTFMKKHLSLQKDINVAAKLNGGQGSDSEQDDAKLDNDSTPSEVTSPEPLPESSSKEELIDSPKSASKDSLIQASLDNKQLTKSSGSAVVSSTTGGNSSTSSRREELLKQLKAVEDAIARKRAKLH